MSSARRRCCFCRWQSCWPRRSPRFLPLPVWRSWSWASFGTAPCHLIWGRLFRPWGRSLFGPCLRCCGRSRRRKQSKPAFPLRRFFFGGASLFAAGSHLDGRRKEAFKTALIFGGFFGFILITFELIANARLSLFHYWDLAGKSFFFTKGGYLLALKPGLATTALFILALGLGGAGSF